MVEQVVLRFKNFLGFDIPDMERVWIIRVEVDGCVDMSWEGTGCGVAGGSVSDGRVLLALLGEGGE